MSIQMMEAMLNERHENWQTEEPPNAQARRHGSQQDLKEKPSLHMADNRQASQTQCCISTHGSIICATGKES
jgi:hypothetical protein